MRETDLEKLIKVYWTFGKAWNKLLLAVQLTNGANDFWHDKCESGTLKGNNLITDCTAVSLYGPLQRAAVRACYVPGCPVHLYFDFVINQINQILFVQQRDQAAVIINAMLNRNDKAMKALTVTLM